MPQTVAGRLKIADGRVNGLLQKNIRIGDIFVDPLVQPVSADNRFGVAFLDAIEQSMGRFAASTRPAACPTSLTACRRGPP